MSTVTRKPGGRQLGGFLPEQLGSCALHDLAIRQRGGRWARPPNAALFGSCRVSFLTTKSQQRSSYNPAWPLGCSGGRGTRDGPEALWLGEKMEVLKSDRGRATFSAHPLDKRWEGNTLPSLKSSDPQHRNGHPTNISRWAGLNLRSCLMKRMLLVLMDPEVGNRHMSGMLTNIGWAAQPG